MDITVTFGWWVLPALASIAAVWWCNSHDYSGSYNFTGLFTLPVTAFVICFAWMLYFGIGWALA